jgi:hypothetical protein
VPSVGLLCILIHVHNLAASAKTNFCTQRVWGIYHCAAGRVTSWSSLFIEKPILVQPVRSFTPDGTQQPETCYPDEATPHFKHTRVSLTSVSLHVDSSLGYLHCVDVDSLADVSELYPIATFRVELEHLPWRCRQHAPPKLRHHYSHPHGANIQENNEHHNKDLKSIIEFSIILPSTNASSDFPTKVMYDFLVF